MQGQGSHHLTSSLLLLLLQQRLDLSLGTVRALRQTWWHPPRMPASIAAGLLAVPW